MMRRVIILSCLFFAGVGICFWMFSLRATWSQPVDLHIIDISSNAVDRAILLVVSNISNRAIVFHQDSCVRISILTGNQWQTERLPYFFNGPAYVSPGFSCQFNYRIPTNAAAAKFELKCQMLSWKTSAALKFQNNHIIYPILNWVSKVCNVTDGGTEMLTNWSPILHFKTSTQ